MDLDMRALERAASLGDEVAAERLALQKARLLPSDRWFLRCGECLSVVALDIPRQKDERGASRPPRNASCACGGKFDPMGRVRQEKLVDDRERCPCDERCTGAAGPMCSCACGGANHGAGNVVEVVTVGNVPTIKPVDVEKAKRQAAEWRAAVKAAEDRVNALPDASLAARRAAGEWLQGEDFSALMRFDHLRRAVRQAAKIQVHALRMKRLAAIAPEKTAPVATVAPVEKSEPLTFDW